MKDKGEKVGKAENFNRTIGKRLGAGAGLPTRNAKESPRSSLNALALAHQCRDIGPHNQAKIRKKRKMKRKRRKGGENEWDDLGSF